MSENANYKGTVRPIPPPRHPLLPASSLLLAACTWGVIWYPYRLLEQAQVTGSLATFATYAVALRYLLYCGRRAREWLGGAMIVAASLLSGKMQPK